MSRFSLNHGTRHRPLSEVPDVRLEETAAKSVLDFQKGRIALTTVTECSMPSRRKKGNGRSKDQLIEDRRNNVRDILKTLGLWDQARRINRCKSILDSHFPKVSIDSAGQTDEARNVVKVLGKVVTKTTVSFPPLGESVPVTDLVSYVLPIFKWCQASVGTDSTAKAFIAEVKKRIQFDTTPNTIATAVQRLYGDLDNEVAKFCRIDSHLFHLKLHAVWNEKKQWVVRFEVCQEPIQKKSVTTETGTRTVFRCGAPFGERGIDWVQWPRSTLGGGGGPPLPVFVQGHALDRLYRRPEEARLNFIQDGDWMIHDYLWQSLREPRVKPIRHQPGKFLVEYWLNKHKLGYLVARQVGDIALVETFLFLTMDSTPEGDLLWKKLRLVKRDKMEIKLDDIRTFLFTDVKFDQELVSILEDCGCGHLFKVIHEQPRSRCLEGYAKDIRKFLGLDA